MWAFSSCSKRELLSSVVHGLLIVGFPLLQNSALGTGALVAAALWLQGTGLVVVAHGHSWPATCGIFLDQGSKRYPLHWQVDFFF